MGFVKEEAALRALGEEVGLEFVDLAETEVDLSLLKKFPAKFIHRETLFPIRAEQRHAGRRHQRPVQSLSAGRTQRGHRADDRAGAGRAAPRSPS